jgi:hypothetical protein
VKRLLSALALASASAICLSAQQAVISVVELAPIQVKGSEIVSTGSPARPLSNGAVLLNDAPRKRLLLFEPSLASFKVLSDSTKASASPMAALMAGIIPFTADSSLMIDPASQSLLVIAPDGSTARVMAVPKSSDIFMLGGNAAFGMPAFDPRGRLIYRAQYAINMMGFTPGSPPPSQPDSAPIVRADFDSRVVDTIAVLKVPAQGKILSMDMAPGSSQPKIKIEVNPMPPADEWAVLTDGTLAIVRAQDYHVDFVDIDGTKRSAPKMPFDWRRATDEEKQTKMDSIKVMFDSAMKSQASRMPAGQRMPAMEIVFPSYDSLPDYHPPVRPGSLRADADGHLWILPTTSSHAGSGLTYDVVNREGQLFQRVQLPPKTSIAGFGKGGVVYLFHYADDAGTRSTLEKTSVTFAKESAQ